MSSAASDAQPVVLIHGMWMTPLSWEHWVGRFTDLGHQVLAPAWPGLDAEPEAAAADPSPLRNLSVTDVVDHYDRIIRGLDRPPIIIGHSFGGLFTQLLARSWPGRGRRHARHGCSQGCPAAPAFDAQGRGPALGNPANLKKELR